MMTPRAGVRTRVRIATGGFRPPAHNLGKRDAKRTEPQGGNALSRLAAACG
ncbi:MAG: hypothetical protein RLZZ436_1784 [Planctomycetota bacterium]